MKWIVLSIGWAGEALYIWPVTPFVCLEQNIDQVWKDCSFKECVLMYITGMEEQNVINNEKFMSRKNRPLWNRE